MLAVVIKVTLLSRRSGLGSGFSEMDCVDAFGLLGTIVMVGFGGAVFDVVVFVDDDFGAMIVDVEELRRAMGIEEVGAEEECVEKEEYEKASKFGGV